MFVAHLPAGYIVSRHLLLHLRSDINAKTVIAAGMLGAIAPDSSRSKRHTYGIKDASAPEKSAE